MASKRTWRIRPILASLVLAAAWTAPGAPAAHAATPPAPVMASLPSWLTTTSVPLSWTAAAGDTPVASFSIRYRRAPWNQGFSAWTTWRTGVTATSASYPGIAGSGYCFAVRAVDAKDVSSAWSKDACVVIPLDDRSFARSGTWTAGTSGTFFRGTYLRTFTRGASITRADVDLEQDIAVVATMCPACGTIRVSWGGRPLATLSLYSPVRVDRKILPVRIQDDDSELVHLGYQRLQITVVSAGAKVILDGVLASRRVAAPAWADGSNPPLPGSSTSGHVVEMISGSSSADAWSEGHTCAVREDGRIVCWGGVYATGARRAPDGTFATVGAGLSFDCALDLDARIRCWNTATATVLPGTPAGEFTQLSVGRDLACAITAQGSAACWGGSGTVDITPPAGSYKRVSAGDDGACGIAANGSIACWGRAQQAPVGAFSELSVGTRHACAIKLDGTPTCWGGNEYGQARSPAGTFTAIAVGDFHSCGIRQDHTVACWGDNEYLESLVPPGSYRAIDAGSHHTCAVRDDGRFACWGQNLVGQVAPQSSASIGALPRWTAATSFPVAWSAGSLAPITSYDVRYRRARWDGAFGSRSSWLSATTVVTAMFKGAPGTTYCLQARARDGDGIATPWTSETCTAVPLDDRAFTRSPGWRAGTGSAYYRGTFVRSSTQGARLTLSGVLGGDVALVVTRCPTCGVIRVYSGRRGSKVFDLYAPERKDRVLLPLWLGTGAGKLTVKVESSGKPVIIDGLAVRRTSRTETWLP